MCEEEHEKRMYSILPIKDKKEDEKEPRTQQICPDEVLPADLLEVRYLLGVQDKTLAAFILETRRADGKPYPGPTLRNSTSLSDSVSLHSVALLLLYYLWLPKN